MGIRWEADRGRRSLWAVVIVGGLHRASVGRGAQLGDVRETSEARDAIGAFSIEAPLRSMLVMATMGSVCESVAAVAVLDGSGGEGGERGGRRGRGATRRRKRMSTPV